MLLIFKCERRENFGLLRKTGNLRNSNTVKYQDLNPSTCHNNNNSSNKNNNNDNNNNNNNNNNNSNER